MTDEEFSCIGEPFSADEVAIIQTVLSGSGIRYVIQSEKTAARGDGVGALAGCRMRLMVATRRAEEAWKLLDRRKPD